MQPVTQPARRRAPAGQVVNVQNSASNEYLRNAVMTASAEQLQLMLYDGAIRFSRQARDAMAKGDLSTSCEKLLRAQRIMVEMENGLKHEVNPELCKQFAALYQFIYQRLVDANIKRDLAVLDEALTILTHQRETWAMLVERVAAGEAEETDSMSMTA